MNPESIDFVKKVEQLLAETGASSIDQSAYAFAAGVAIARETTLPTKAQLSSPEYMDALNASVAKKLNYLNELKVLDIDLAAKTFKATFKVRVNALYPKKIISLSSDECICCDIFSISDEFKDIDTSIYQQYKGTVVRFIELITLQLAKQAG